MYNEKYKNDYINQKKDQVILAERYIEGIFAKTEFFEIRLGKDISEFTSYEIVDMYKMLNYPSLDSLVILNSILSQYTQYCINDKKVRDNQNHYLEVNIDVLSNCVNRAIQKLRFVDSKQIYTWCDELPNACDAFVLLALFCGIKGKNFCEIVNAKITDFTNENEFRTYTYRNIIVPRKLYDIAIEANAATIYYSMSANHTKTTSFRADDDYIVKSYPNAKENTNEFHQGRRLYNKIVRIFDFLGIKDYMNANAIVESGMIEAIKKEKELRGCTLNELIYDEQFCEHIKKQYDKVIIPSMFEHKYGVLFDNIT